MKAAKTTQKEFTEALANCKNISDFEALGKKLSVAQFQMLLELYVKGKERDRDKLFPLLVGMNPQIFTQCLDSLSPQQIEVLKREAMIEPLQHQLSMACHVLTSEIAHLNDFSFSLYKLLEPSNIGSFSRKDLKIALEKIVNVAESYKQILVKIDRALTIAWNTVRTDLVDNLSILKENCQKFLKEIFGFSEIDWGKELNEEFIAHLTSAVYGDPNNPDDIDALHDDESAVEFLAKLQIWYPQDYFEVGLLPGISENKLKLPTHRDKLLEKAHRNLKDLGLITVKDVREAGIFSKKSLVEYINSHC